MKYKVKVTAAFKYRACKGEHCLTYNLSNCVIKWKYIHYFCFLQPTLIFMYILSYICTDAISRTRNYI